MTCATAAVSTTLVGLGAFVHYPMEHLQQMGSVFLAVDIEVLNNLLGAYGHIIRRVEL